MTNRLKFTIDLTLPPGDYPMTIAELRNSILVSGEDTGRDDWDQEWRLQLVDNGEQLMIRSDAQYKHEKAGLEQSRQLAEAKRLEYKDKGYPPAVIDKLMGPTECSQSDIADELEEYERIKKGQIPKIHRLDQIGDFLIAARIAKGWNQEQLANALGITPTAVSQAEKIEYSGVTAARAQRVLDRLGVQIVLTATSIESPAGETGASGPARFASMEPPFIERWSPGASLFPNAISNMRGVQHDRLALPPAQTETIWS